MVELTETFKLECEELDKDHKHLLEMVNDIAKNIDEGKTIYCRDKVNEFVNFAKEHFYREEKFLEKNGYPQSITHHQHHQTLITKMEHIKKIAASLEKNKLARVSLKRELIYLLMDDLITTDMDFKSYVKKGHT